jgi:hypothetical protein
MSVRTGMYHFEVSRTAMYRVRYVLVRTSTYRHVLPCTRCTGFQMDSGGPADSGGAGSGSGCAASATVCSVSARPGCRQRDSEPRRLGVTVRVTQAASGSH